MLRSAAALFGCRGSGTRRLVRFDLKFAKATLCNSYIDLAQMKQNLRTVRDILLIILCLVTRRQHKSMYFI